MLLERIDTTDKANPFARLAAAGKVLSAVLGKETAFDYALFDLKSQQIVPINIPLRGKTVGEATGCRAKNMFVNKCSGRRTWESIWDADGAPNRRHYFWAVNWFVTKHGPIAAVMENGSKEVNVIKLETGERFNAFKRPLGITSFDATPTLDGSLSVQASWMFKKHELADVVTLFSGAPISQ